MNIFNIKKLKSLDILLFIFILLIIYLLFNYNNKEGFNEKTKIIKKKGNEIFDEFYCNIYDDLVLCEDKNIFEINTLFEKVKCNSNSKILDVGSSTGHHVKLISEKCKNVIGIDKSYYMVKKAETNYEDLNFQQGDVLKTITFNDNTFSHITCLYFTIYYFKDKEKFLQNCFYWLNPGGILLLHLVDVNNFDPILPPSNPITAVSPQNYVDQRMTKSEVIFDKINYKSDFILDKKVNINNNLKECNAVFKEKIKYNDKNIVRINEHDLFMNSRKYIIGIAKNVGFSVLSIHRMNNINYDHNYLYTLIKPN
tara:strand:+ start:2063 stop:2992 length:930 start_codon:yes stop_codon:yes gene_type:complete